MIYRGHNFELYVATAYFSGVDPAATQPVDIRIFVDGKEVVSGNFSYSAHRRQPERFSISLAAGRHKLLCMSAKGKAQFETDFQISKELQSAIVMYEYFMDDSGKQAGRFSVNLLDGRPYFQ